MLVQCFNLLYIINVIIIDNLRMEQAVGFVPMSVYGDGGKGYVCGTVMQGGSTASD